MIDWSRILVFVYLAILACGLVLSFTARQQNRRLIGFVTGIASIPFWLWVALVGYLWFMSSKEPPTLGELQRDFASKRSDLETILRMSNEDANFTRIAPDSLDRIPNGPNDPGRLTKDDPRGGLPEARWDAYRKIYARDGIKVGIERNLLRDAFIMVDSNEVLYSGHVSGYLYCAPSAQTGTYRYPPCTLHLEKEERRHDPADLNKGYAFQRLDERWYAYDQGSSRYQF
jgi:hypothetical protein